MLILTRYNGQRIVVQSSSGQEIWISCDSQGVFIEGDPIIPIPWEDRVHEELDGELITVIHIGSIGRVKTQHKIGIDAPADYLILREELLTRGERA
jgi:sRNA-binding carbon storage regulator CsrA